MSNEENEFDERISFEEYNQKTSRIIETELKAGEVL